MDFFMRVKRNGEKSFTLLETLFAIGLMVSLIATVSTTQGRALYHSNSSRDTIQAIWLAKSVMSSIEYKSKFYSLRHFLFEDPTMFNTKQSFPPELCDASKGCDYTYDYTIKEWKLPIIDLIFSPDGDFSKGKFGAFSGDFKRILVDILGEHILKVAHVEVYRPVGSVRKKIVELAYVLTTQEFLDIK